MLTALEQGVKGGKWFSLIDKVHPERTLRAAFSQVAANEGAAGVDHVTIAMFDERSGRGSEATQRTTADGDLPPAGDPPTLHPQTGDAGKRPLGIPTVRDRVVQTALRMVFEPIFELRIRRAQLRLSPRTGMQRRAATSG